MEMLNKRSSLNRTNIYGSFNRFLDGILSLFFYHWKEKWKATGLHSKGDEIFIAFSFLYFAIEPCFDFWANHFWQLERPKWPPRSVSDVSIARFYRPNRLMLSLLSKPPSEQFQSSTRAVPDQSQSNLRAAAFKAGHLEFEFESRFSKSRFSAMSEQFQSNFRAISEQFAFGAVRVVTQCYFRAAIALL